jgi:signal peptidase I
MRSLRRLLAIFVVGLVLVAGAGLAAHRVAHVVTNGVSMQPTYFAGDLVIVAKASHYNVGDIAAYKVPGREMLVLHRIIKGDGRGFTFKGDNNQSIDPYTPRTDELVGRAVLHVPKVGKVLASPVTRGGVLALVLLVLGALTMKTDRTAATTAGAPAHRAARPKGRLAWKAMLALDVLLLLAFGGAQVVARSDDTASSTADAPTTKPPTQTIDLAYAADVPASETYPTGHVVTGDAVFTQLLDQVDVRLHYRTDVAAIGTAQLDLRLSAAGGWHTTQALIPATTIVDGRLDVAAPLRLSDIRALAARVAEQTGTSAGVIDVVVVASGEGATGSAEPTPFQAELPLRLDARTLTMSGDTETTTADTDEAAPVARTSVPFNATAKADDPAKTSTAPDLRTPALIALLLAIGATAVLWPTNDDDLDPSTITAPQVLRVDLPVTTARIQVADRAAVDAIARAAARPVIVGTEWEGVLTAEAVYWCTSSRTPSNLSAPGTPAPTPMTADR